MSRITFSLSDGLSASQCREVYDGALEILRRIGIEVPLERAVKDLSGQHGFRADGNRIRIAPDAVEDAADAYVRDGYGSSRHQQNPTRISLVFGGQSPHFIDLDTGDVRPALSSDVVTVSRLAHAFGISGDAPVSPADVAPPLRDMLAFKLGVEHHPGTDPSPGAMSTPLQARTAFEMCRVLNKSFTLGLWTSSPLELSREGLACLYELAEEDITVNIASMPLYGATTALDLGTCLAQSFAEILGTLAVVSAIVRNRPSHIGQMVIDITGFDMRAANAVYGSPEQLLLIAAYFQCLRHRHGRDIRPESKLLGMGKLPDAQTGAERALGVLFLALAGAKSFFGAGRISRGDIYSVEQFVIDVEICRYVSRIQEGLSWRDEGPDLDLVDRVGPHGTFLTTDELVGGFRQEIWSPDLFSYERYESWSANGEKSVRETALDIARRMIASSDFEIEDEKRRGLDSIYEAFKKQTFK